MLHDLRDRLGALEDRLRSLREERMRAAQVAEAAKAAYGGAREDTEPAAFAAAKQASDAVKAVEAKIDEASEGQVELLRRLGDAEQGRAGLSYIGVDGWGEAARKLDLARNELRFDVSAAALLTPTLPPSQRQSVPPPAQGAASGAAPPVSNRWLYPVLQSAPFGSSSGDLAATDFVLDVTQDALTGVEIAPATDTEKSVLTPDIGLANPVARTFAIVNEGLPEQLFSNQDALRAALSADLGRRLSESFDSHVVWKIEAATPPHASTGSDLVTKIRNAIADARDLGSTPTHVALTPSDCATLDLSEDGAGHMIFRVDREGSGSPVWSLQVREVPTISHPTLIDPVLLGLSYYAGATILVDPYTGLSSNQVRVRVECEAVFHVRNIGQGAFSIS